MLFSQLSFIVTDDCNFNCSYCPQIKEKIYMKRPTIDKAIAFFYPFLDKEAYIAFYGGEPLLAFDTIKYAVSLLQEKDIEGKKRWKFSLTTNGSLLTDEILHFFDRHHFDILLSFDGLSQDISRKPGSLSSILQLILNFKEGMYPGIKFSTNSVFTPKSINYLSASMQYIIESGITDMEFSFAQNIPWDEAAFLVLEKELASLTNFLINYYKKEGSIPVRNFRRAEPSPVTNKDITCFTCIAGAQRMSISPGENVWGCYVFHDYFKNQKENPDFHAYRFGTLDDFIKNHEFIYPQILKNCTVLKQNSFFTENQYCLICEEVNNCSVCPVSAAYATSIIGKISPWVCRTHQIHKEVKKKFLSKTARLNPSL